MIGAGQLRRLVKLIYYWFLCLVFGSGRKTRRSPLKQRLVDIAPGSKNTAVAVAIYGKVARVGFRSWLRQRAGLHQLESLVFYGAPHILGAVFIGSQEELEAIVRAAWLGPTRARVYQIKEKWLNRHASSAPKKTEAAPPCSRETIASLKEALAHLGPVMQRPNRFPVKGKYSNAAELARAAEERNLFIARLGNVNYVVSPQKELGLQQSQSHRVSSLVRSLTDHKQLAKDHLAALGLPVPKGRLFSDFDRAADYLAECGYPLVVKPLQGSYGLGVTVDVRTAEELRAAFGYARQYHEQVILEEFVQGLDVRVLVIGGKAGAALSRIPAHVTGDGKSSIDRLILQKNRLRFENPRLGKAPIIPDRDIDRFLARQGYSLESIPEKGEVVFLRLKANIGAGADSVVLTDQIHPDLMRLAEEAAAAFGVVDFWGVDLLVERIDRPRGEQRTVILEVNSRANIFNVQFPLYGVPFDAARSLIDSLLPEETPDSAYPCEALEIEVTGRFSSRFLKRAGKAARRLALRGHIRQVGSAAQAVVYGRKHRVLTFLDRLWGWREGDWLVDGLGLSAHNGTAEKTFRVIREQDLPATQPGFTADASQPCLQKAARRTYGFTPEDRARGAEINTALFLEEFANRGYRAEALGDGLLKIKRENRLGITNIYFSSLFCDKACGNIHPAKKILALKGIPVLRGLRFKMSELNQALRYFDRLRGSCVLTIVHPQQGNSSQLISAKEELSAAWRKAVNRGVRYFIIEEQLPGRNICAAVIAGQFAGAQMRLPLSLCGDGVLMPAQLIEKKNEARSMNPWYRDKLLPDAGHFKKQFAATGYRPDEILPRGERLYLETEAVLELGGETVGLKNYLHRDFKDMAVKAVGAIPGLELAFVHLIVPRPDEPASKQQWAVKRIETRPAPAAFHFPWRGEPHNLVEKIVERLCLTEGTLWRGPPSR